MKWRAIVLCSVLVLVCAAVPALAACNRHYFIKPGTPEAARAMSRLRQARHIDWMNSRSFSGGEDSAAAAFYYHKAQQADALLWRLHERQPVLTDEVRRALDNSDAWRYGGTL